MRLCSLSLLLLLLLLLLSLLLLPGSPALADPFSPPGVTDLDEVGSHALLTNPAMLGFLRGVDWRVAATRGEAASGGVVSVAGRVLGRLSPALAVGGFTWPKQEQGAAWLSGGAALSLGDRSALGLSVAGALGDPGGALDGAVSTRVGLATRPARWLTMAASFTGCTGGPTALFPTRRYGAALGVRPYRHWVELQAAVSHVHGEGAPRLTGKLQLRPWGGLSLAPYVTLDDDERWVGALLGVAIERLSLLGGAQAGLDGGDLSGALVFGGARAPAEPRFRLPGRTRVVNLSRGEHEGAQGFLSLLMALREAIDDDTTREIALRLDALSLNLSQTLELAGVLEEARGRDVAISAYLDGANLKTLLLLGPADRVTIQPAAFIEVHGVRLSSVYLADLLSKIGIRVELVAIGQHKSAPEMFTRRGQSEAARGQSERLMAALNELVDQRWRFAREELRALQASSVLATQDAVTRLPTLTIQAFPAWWRSLRRPTTLGEAEATPPGWARRPRVAVIPLSGIVMGGRGMQAPLLGVNTIGVADVVEKIEAAMADPDVVAVVLRVSSGGGSSQASEELYHWIRHHRETKPIHVSISGLCASGCVYLAAGADQIMAERGAVIGSVGIFGGKADLTGLLAWLGVTTEEVGLEDRGRAPFSPHRPFSDIERRALKRALEMGYETFVARVKEHGAKEEVSDARVVETSEALTLGLIDRVGGFPQMIEMIEQEVGARVDLSFPEPQGVMAWIARLGGLAAELGRWQAYHLAPYWTAP